MSVEAGGISAAGVVFKAFGKDVIEAIDHPKSDHVETIVEKGKIKEVAHEKIFKGGLAEFKGRQDSVALSIMNAAHRLAGGSEIFGDDQKTTEKIFKTALREVGDSSEAKKSLARELKIYANKLLESNMHRRGQLKSQSGEVDREVFWHLATTSEQVEKRLAEQFTELKAVNALAADIERNGISNQRLSIQNSEGQDITPVADNVYEFAKGILESSLRCLKMTEGPEGAFNAKGMEVLDKFKAHVLQQNPKSTDADLKNLSPDQLRGAIQSFVEELKGSRDSELNKLAFALLCANQTWVTTLGSAFNLIAREAYGHERFSTGAATQLHSQTQFNLKFETDGSISLAAMTGFTNRDYEQKGREDYICQTLAEVKMRRRGGDDLKVKSSTILHHPLGEAEGIVKLRDALILAGYDVQTKGSQLNTLLARQALVANTLIEAIRSKGLKSFGIIRESGAKQDSETLAQTMIKQANLWDLEKVLLQPQIIESTDVNNLVSALKHILKDHLALIPKDKVEDFLKLGAEEIPLDKMRKFVATLPEENQSVLRNVCRLCHEVIALSEQNKMPAENVGIALAPSIVPDADPLLFEEQKLAFLKLLEAFPLR